MSTKMDFIGFKPSLTFLKPGDYKVRFELGGWDNEQEIAEYAVFRIGKEGSEYTLALSGYNSTGTSTAKDGTVSGNDNQPFRTNWMPGEGKRREVFSLSGQSNV
ncbi:unnamed protein product [Owenia fusiformis]|uniref:Uncharacterized protein n=1 Tax=Owenia fusiformis TaxID=6347 RepID=A0A8J1UNA1_OWEFU|nr:unnamed protein product [Owenia fusiformis]